MAQIILASASPRRKDILTSHGIDFICCPSGVNEQDIAKGINNPDLICQKLAYYKAEDIFKKNKNATVLGADTAVVLNGVIFGKPKNENDAYNMLKSLSGKTHTVITGVAVLSKNMQTCYSEQTKVTFFELNDNEIYEYIATGECIDKAGSYAIQGIGKKFIKSIEGDYENVVGLPLSAVEILLKLGR